MWCHVLLCHKSFLVISVFSFPQGVTSAQFAVIVKELPPLVTEADLHVSQVRVERGKEKEEGGRGSPAHPSTLCYS